MKFTKGQEVQVLNSEKVCHDYWGLRGIVQDNGSPVMKCTRPNGNPMLRKTGKTEYYVKFHGEEFEKLKLSRVNYTDGLGLSEDEIEPCP